MDCTCIPYTRVPKSSALLSDYLYHYDRVSAFYSGPPFDVASYKSLASAIKPANHRRQELVEILTRQNRELGCGEETFANIRRLQDPETFAVVTGQQVGLLSGPVFTLYKALTAVRVSQQLAEKGLAAVCVFWLATEDHDLEEVAVTAVLDEEHNLIPLSDPGERPAPRSSVGYVRLSAAIDGALKQLESVLPPGESRDRLLEDLRASYQTGVAWGRAFGRFMARLFSRWGVVFIDPLDEAVHRLSANIYQQALEQAGKLREILKQRSQALVQAGYHAQVHVAEDSTLLFAARGGNRIAVDQLGASSGNGGATHFRLDGSEKVGARELKSWIQERPLEFTPNALLRPIVQDSLLPTAAYVAGPSELAYLGQAQAIYPEFGRPMPVVFPRASFTLLDRRIQRLMEKYDLGLEDAWKGEEHLARKIASAGQSDSETPNWSEHFDRTQLEVVRLLDQLQQDLARLDPTLVDSLKHAREKMVYQLDRLKGKVSRAALERSELLARHERMLLGFLTPGKNLQERQVSGVYFLGRAGYELLDRLLDKIQFQSSDHQLVSY